ncbi:MAG: protein-methionine-sulfoxide reductase catalytic subunit MsrP [SAR324 cluster bacterium]|nr:protein-methionine-sulfoxide reductase catalytic subunit MsrP [SAR324 cluster bacterium]
MHIKCRKSWEIPESEITPHSVYCNRRTLLKAMGFAGSATLMSSILQAATAGFPSNPNKSFDDLETTSEDLATSYNNFYEFSTDKQAVKSLSRNFQTEPWTLEIGGLCGKPQTLDVNQLASSIGLEQRIYRFRCVETWSMVVPWDGFPLKKILALAEPSSSAKFIKFSSFYRPDEAPGQKSKWYPWPYVEGLTMEEAANELAFIATGMYGKPLPPQNGAPLRLVVPWKYGFKSIKAITKIEFVDTMPTSLWMALAPDEYGFYANVNPEVSHPRWSQAQEKPLGSWFGKVPTKMFNGYEHEVGGLYKNLDLRKWY